MWFGYLNRNFEEEVEVPVGTNNRFSLQPDMGQPTHFYPRRNRFVFQVEVPANWTEDKRLVWTLTVHGQSNSANGWLQPEWEVDDGVIQMNLGLDTAPPDPPNSPPAIVVKGDTTASAGRPLRLSASAADDGIPKPRRPTNFQLSGPAPPAVPIPVTVPPRAVRGLRIRWILYRAPETAGRVTFEPRGTAPALGATSAELVTAATFSDPGVYWLRAIASDGLLETPSDLRVTVVK
ncbi:MAG: hypothetical protein FJW39_00840 [Acidobacteria bacterium]|nr:hypothetical protein [Acidobacteriota bacterium]